jgi:hypothetical protein
MERGIRRVDPPAAAVFLRLCLSMRAAFGYSARQQQLVRTQTPPTLLRLPLAANDRVEREKCQTGNTKIQI